MSANDPFAIAGNTRIPGFFYEPHFLTEKEETGLIEQIITVPLRPAQYKQYEARRRVHSYGGRFDYETQQLLPAEPIAAFLHPLRERVCLWSGHPPERFTQALIAEYAPGVPLGWHRDVPEFELVVGISLGGSGTMRFRRYPPKKREPSLGVELEPRSIYRLEGSARWEWQHRIAPTPGLRYSITFRTLREA